MNAKKSLERLEWLEYAAFLMQISKDLLVVLCMVATIASGCRIERTAAKYDAQIAELKQAAVEFKQCSSADNRDEGAQ